MKKSFLITIIMITLFYVSNQISTCLAQTNHQEADISILESNYDDIVDSLSKYYLKLGNYYIEKHDLQKALDCYKKSLEFNPDYEPAYYNLGQCYNFIAETFVKTNINKMSKYKYEAVDTFIEFINKYSNSNKIETSKYKDNKKEIYKYYNAAGQILLYRLPSLNNLELAKGYFDEAIILSRNVFNEPTSFFIDAYAQRAWTGLTIADFYKRINFITEAEKAYQTTLQILDGYIKRFGEENPKVSGFYQIKGHIYFYGLPENRNLAIKCFIKAKMGNFSFMVYCYLIDIYRSLAYEQCVKKSPDNYQKAIEFYKKAVNEAEEALGKPHLKNFFKDFRKCAALDYFRVAEIMFKNIEDYENAAKEYKISLQYYKELVPETEIPEQVKVLESKANEFFNQQNYNEASKKYKEAIQIIQTFIASRDDFRVYEISLDYNELFMQEFMTNTLEPDFSENQQHSKIEIQKK